MAKFTRAPPQSEDEEYALPKYSDRGRILVKLLGPCASGVYQYEYEVLCYESDSSVFWINEGQGFDYWLDANCEFPASTGVFVIEGVCGFYHRGTFGFDDDSEEWEFARIREATPEEIAAEALL